MRTAFVLFLMVILALGGKAQQNCQDCGSGYFRDRLFKPELNRYVLGKYERDTRFLFFDSMMIVERHRIEIENDRTTNKEKWRRIVIGYKFVDFRSQTFYEYRHLSDTARILKANRHPYGQLGGGGMYFGDPRQPHRSTPLPDTVLNSEKCHRLKGIYFHNGDTSLIETMYYVEEAERPLAYHGKTIINGKRYSFIRLETTNLIPTKLKSYSVMDITSRNLTKKELRVFAAWKRNADRHPVPE